MPRLSYSQYIYSQYILNEATTHFFVYGTLKRGECREFCWPRKPLQVEPAWVFGELYDTGPYPALRPGSDAILGEVWSYATADYSVVAHVLDEIEEYRAVRAENLYMRDLLNCTTLDGRILNAHGYIYSQRKHIPTFKRILPSTQASGMTFASWGKRFGET